MDSSVTNVNVNLNNFPLEKNEANQGSCCDKSDANDQKSEKFLKITNFFPVLKQELKTKLQHQTVDLKQDSMATLFTVKEEISAKEQLPSSSLGITSSIPVTEVASPVCNTQAVLQVKNINPLNNAINVSILKKSISQILRLKMRCGDLKKGTNAHVCSSGTSKEEQTQARVTSENQALCTAEKLVKKGNETLVSFTDRGTESQMLCKARKGASAYSAKSFISTSLPSPKPTSVPHDLGSLIKQPSEPLPISITKSTILEEEIVEVVTQLTHETENLKSPLAEVKSASQHSLTVDTVAPDQTVSSSSTSETPNHNTNYIISPKKQKRRHFKGATYNLYLSPSKKRKHKKKHSDTSSSVKDDESSIGGNENDSFIDSEGDNSLCSEDYCSLSEKSVQEDDPVSPVTNNLVLTNKINVTKESDGVNCFESYSRQPGSSPDMSSAVEDSVAQVNKCNTLSERPFDSNKDSIIRYNDDSILVPQGGDNDTTEDLEFNLEVTSVNDKQITYNAEIDEVLISQNKKDLGQKIISSVSCSDSTHEELVFGQVHSNIKCSQDVQRSNIFDDDSKCFKNDITHPKCSETTVESSVVEIIQNDENCDLGNHSANGTIKDNSLSTIATCVKSRQRIKRRFTDDIVDTDAGILSLNCMASSKRSKDNCSSILKPLTVNKVDTKLGPASKLECVYDYKLSLVGKCACGEMPVTPTKLKSKVYCQAVDSFYESRLGCCNTVVTQKLVHSSVKHPFIMMCEMHLWRLGHHHCCPGCGLFCSEGTFMACSGQINDAKDMHFFHHQCMNSSEANELCCPHCGNSLTVKSINLEYHASVPPDFSHRQELLSSKARMTFNKQIETEINTTTSANAYTIHETGKVISSVGLPQGSERIELEAMLITLKSEKALAPKYSIQDMYTAASAGDITKVLYMIALGFDPNFKFVEHENETTLHTAAAAGNLLVVHLLLQAGAVPDSMNDRLYTPLMLAIERHHQDIITYLIGAGAHLQAQGEDGMTCLHLAAKSGNADMCGVLLNSGIIDVNIQDEGGWTPMVWATEHKHLNVVKLLVRRGADPNIMDNEENIGLHWSAFSGSPEICQLFLEMGCDVNAVNEHGDTPLHIAARQDVYECIFLFLSRGGNSQAFNKANKTPSECCVDQTSEAYLALSMNMTLRKIISKFNHKAEKVIHRDISKGKEKIPIQCVNSVDKEPPPFDFLYILENCETSPINFDRTTTTLSSCKCVADCYSFGCACGNISFRCWYDKEGCLVPEFNFLDPPLIFECNRTCSCWQNCGNRVIQHGIVCRLQLIRTKGKGWGVRTLKDIPKGAFICEYVGELITDPEADRRAEDSYLFDLDYKDGDTFCLDARFYGNVSRFINHLCEPNLIPVKAFVDHQDLRYPRIAFFSSREIKAYEELGFDYGEKFWSIKYKSFTCHCNSPKCKYSKDMVLETLANYNRRLREEQGES